MSINPARCAKALTRLASTVTGLDYVRNTAATYGLTRTITNHLDGHAHKISATGLIGVEDIAIDPEHGVAYLSAADRRTAMNGDGSHTGALFRYDLTTPGAQPEQISDPDEPLYPHGISLWCAPDGHRELYVVVHLDHRHSVRRYIIDGPSARYVESFEHQLIRSPNDLTVVGEREFYVTNDHHFTTEIGQTVEHFLRLPLSDVIHVNHANYQVALSKVPFANGIVWHPDHCQIYLSAMTRREVWACDLLPDGRLRHARTFATNLCVDNIEIGSDRRLWIGGHPRVLQLPRYAKNADIASPSQVIALDPATGHYDTIFEDDGRQLSGCSVGANWRDRLLIGSVMEPFILDCTLSTAPSPNNLRPGR